MRYVMSRILGSDGDSKRLRSPGVHPPLGDRGGQSGGHSRALCGCGRNQAFFVLMAGAGLVGEAPCAGKILRLTAVQRGLDRFPLWVGRERQRPGGDTSIAGQRLARCRAIPLSGWVVAEAWLTRPAAAALRRPGGHITSRRLTAFSPAAPEECTKSNR